MTDKGVQNDVQAVEVEVDRFKKMESKKESNSQKGEQTQRKSKSAKKAEKVNVKIIRNTAVGNFIYKIGEHELTQKEYKNFVKLGVDLVKLK